MKIAQHFDIREFVPRSIWDRFGTSSLWFIRPEVPVFADGVRNHFGLATRCNDWLWGGRSHYRGYRPRTVNIGADNSIHRLGGALDLIVSGVSGNDVVEEVIANQQKFFDLGVRAVLRYKSPRTYAHLDCRNTGMSKLFIIDV